MKSLELIDLLALRHEPIALQEQSVILMIADISGYTEFMLSTQTALLHGQMIISELIESLIEQVEIPLKVAKLEGDAVFLYAVQESSEIGQQIGTKLPTFFSAFSEKLNQLGTTIHCTCDACVNIGGLRLKIVVHTGRAAFYRIGDFLELSGVDVIIIHRLLKNRVGLPEYILMTEGAFKAIALPSTYETQAWEETYPVIGPIRMRLYPIQDSVAHIDPQDHLNQRHTRGVGNVTGGKSIIDSVFRSFKRNSIFRKK